MSMVGIELTHESGQCNIILDMWTYPVVVNILSVHSSPCQPNVYGGNVVDLKIALCCVTCILP